jgi:hypothetical protein
MDGGEPTLIWRPAHLSRAAALDDAVVMNARLSQFGALAVGATVVACAAPSIAGATDYCVGSNTSCAPANHRDNLQNALTDAANTPEADRILLGAETYTAGTVAGYVYNAPTSRVEIVGAGTGKTVLTGQTDGESILHLSGGTGSSVSDLTIRLPDKAWAGLNTDNAARRIEVDEAAGAQFSPAATGIYLNNGATLEDSTVSFIRAPTGVFVTNGHVIRSSVNAFTAIKVNNGSIERSRAAGFTGVEAYGGTTSIVDSQLLGGEEYGIQVGSYAGVDRTIVNAANVTILGGDVGTGVYATTQLDAAWSAEVHLTNAVIRGFPSSLGASALGTGEAKVVTSYSDYDPPSAGAATGAKASISEANISDVGDGGFVNTAARDYHLLPGSPLIDAGDPATAQGLDLDGKPLVTDGNGDGSARRDIGAFEAPAVPFTGQPGGGSPGGGSPGPDTKAPVISGFRATPALFAVGRAATPRAARVHRNTRFRYTLSEQARVSLKIQRRLRGRRARYRTVGRLTRSGKVGVNRIRFTGRIGKRALRPGRYRARITAIDAAGNRSAPRKTRFRIAR